jgi:hypothetical protein
VLGDAVFRQLIGMLAACHSVVQTAVDLKTIIGIKQ